MIAVALFDALSQDTHVDTVNRPVAEIAGLAEKYVASSLDDWQHVLDCEEEVSRIAPATPALEDAINRALHQVYQEWALDAEQVLIRIRQFITQGHSVNDVEALEDAYARVQARLKLTPEMVEQAMQQIRQGKAVPIKELRDELCARVRA